MVDYRKVSSIVPHHNPPLIIEIYFQIRGWLEAIFDTGVEHPPTHTHTR